MKKQHYAFYFENETNSFKKIEGFYDSTGERSRDQEFCFKSHSPFFRRINCQCYLLWVRRS